MKAVPRAEPDTAANVGLATAANQEVSMKGLVAWWLGVPVIVIVILYLTGIF